jgi:hypothetical protein
MGSISRYSVGTTPKPIGIDGGGRVLIRVVDADVQIAYNQSDFGVDQYYTIPAGTTFVLDPPNLVNELIYLQTASGTATVEVWVMGGY